MLLSHIVSLGAAPAGGSTSVAYVFPELGVPSAESDT